MINLRSRIVGLAALAADLTLTWCTWDLYDESTCCTRVLEFAELSDRIVTFGFRM